MAEKSAIDWIAIVLIIIGGINWGLVGAFDYNLVDTLLGDVLTRVVYVLVGIGALYAIYMSTRKS